jgi:VWFA-related protein
MKKIIFASLFIFLFSVLIFAQAPTPTPTPNDDDNDVVKISTTLIQVDVTVTDKKGKQVKDLKAEDFEIYENKEKQNITNFSYVSVSSEKTTATPKPTPNQNDKLAPPAPPNKLKAENTRRTIALVVDDLSLSFESVYYTRRALKKFVDEQMQEGDLVAIIRVGSGIGALQQFTSDKRQLYAAIEKVRWNPAGNGGISAFPPIEASFEDLVANSEADSQTSNSDDTSTTPINSTQELTNTQNTKFAVGTLGALNYIVKGMKELPGRKAIMVFSDGFSLITPEGTNNAAIIEQLHVLTDLANRAGVVIYTNDARGLQTLALTAADNTSDLTSDQISQKVDDRKNQLLDNQQGLDYLAEETGGRLFKNGNDLNVGIDKMLEDQSGYYLIGYQPDDETFDPKKRKFNKLTIKIKRPDLQVRYRSGFFGIEDDKFSLNQPNTSPDQKIVNALTSPFVINEIAVKLNTLFANDKKLGMYLRPLLHIDAKTLDFEKQADGKYKTSFNLIAMTFGDNGIPIDQFSKNYTLSLTENSYKIAQEKGFVYNLDVPIKKAGAYQFRIALQDTKSKKLGSATQFIEVPNVKKNRLTLSSLVLENYQESDLQKLKIDHAFVPKTAPLSDTALRRFQRNTVLKYGLEIYNAKLGSDQKPQLDFQLRLFKDGKIYYENKPSKINLNGKIMPDKTLLGGAFSLGNELPFGEYVLQIVVFDALAKEKNRIATQSIEFEVIE